MPSECYGTKGKKVQVMSPEKLQLAEGAGPAQKRNCNRPAGPRVYAVHPGQVRFLGFGLIIRKTDAATRQRSLKAVGVVSTERPLGFPMLLSL